VWAADGSRNFSFVKAGAPEIVLDVTFEHNAAAVAQKVLWRAGTARQVRLIWTGTALTTPSSDHTTKKLIIDLSGAWEKFSELGEQDGNDIVTGTFRVRNNDRAGVAGLFAQYMVVTDALAAIP